MQKNFIAIYKKDLSLRKDGKKIKLKGENRDTKSKVYHRITKSNYTQRNQVKS